MPRRPSRAARGRSSRGTGRLPARRSGCPGSPGCFATTIRSRRESAARWRESRPDVVVVSGWSTFASQAAIAWSPRARDPVRAARREPRPRPAPRWRRAVKGTVVPRDRCARPPVCSLVGTASRESLVARGARPGTRARLREHDRRCRVGGARRGAARTTVGAAGRLGAADDDVVVLSVARLVSGERARHARPRRRGDRRRAPSGRRRRRRPGRAAAEELARQPEASGCDLTGDLCRGRRSPRRTSRADVFALLSTHETWGVVVNEAAASGLPLVLSDRVGAAHDLLRDGENGFLVPAGDVAADRCGSAAARRRSALREQAGERSRELVREWGYEPSVESFVAAVREATSR